MTQSLLEARRTAQEVAKLHRHVRHLRKKGQLSEAEAELQVFRTERVFAVPSGAWRALMDLLAETGEQPEPSTERQ